MAITQVQSAAFADNAAGTIVTGTFASTPTNGNLLIGWSQGVSASSGGSISGWNGISVQAQVGSSSGFVGIFYKVAGAGEPKTAILTMPGSSDTKIVLEEWSGLNNSVLDKTAKTDNTGGVTSKSTNTTSTTTDPNELLISVAGMGNAVTLPSWSNSFATEFSKPVGSIVFVGGSKVVSATGAYETTLSWTTSRVAGACIATFKAGSSVGGAIIPIFMNQYRQRV